MEEKVTEKEEGDPKEEMKKEKASATDIPFFFGKMIAAPFNDAKTKGHIRGHIRLENIPPKAN